MFDQDRPTLTDPFVTGRELKWSKSKQSSVFYFWACAVPIDISFNDGYSPSKIDLENGNTLEVYSNAAKIELLYRLSLRRKPNRFLCKPFDHALFWTYGEEGGPSNLIKYLFKDKNLSINKWVDKESYLSVVRTNHFAHYDCAFWAR